MTKKGFSEILGDELKKILWIGKFLVNNRLKKVVRNFATLIDNSFKRDFFEKIRGHPRTPLAPGIQQPLHATVWNISPSKRLLPTNEMHDTEEENRPTVKQIQWKQWEKKEN